MALFRKPFTVVVENQVEQIVGGNVEGYDLSAPFNLSCDIQEMEQGRAFNDTGLELSNPAIMLTEISDGALVFDGAKVTNGARVYTVVKGPTYLDSEPLTAYCEFWIDRSIK